jgi:hypothetical protein
MVDGNRGNLGIHRNMYSSSYGAAEGLLGSNPTLTARISNF